MPFLWQTVPFRVHDVGTAGEQTSMPDALLHSLDVRHSLVANVASEPCRIGEQQSAPLGQSLASSQAIAVTLLRLPHARNRASSVGDAGAGLHACVLPTDFLIRWDHK